MYTPPLPWSFPLADDPGDLLVQMSDRVLVDQVGDNVIRAARCGIWPAEAWAALEEQGLPLALVEGEEGFGIPLVEALPLLKLLGRHATPLPIAETMIANHLLARASLPVPDGPLTLVPSSKHIQLSEQGGRWHAKGEAKRVPWGASAKSIVFELDGRLALMTSGFSATRRGQNLAHMPRDDLALEGHAQVAPISGATIFELGALVRALTMAGALETILAMTIRHVAERVQFGRPIMSFQAVQHLLARLAAESSAGVAGAGLASQAFTQGSDKLGIAIAAARSRLGEAAGRAISIAHQLHGAIGFTEEHQLHWFTTALWSWRDEFGTSSFWTRRLGAAALGCYKSTYWPFITSVSLP